MSRAIWPAILERAAEIVESYSTEVTLRQLFYRLVAEGVLENRKSVYQHLSAHTAQARRAGGFPDLVDNTREIMRAQTWASAESARHWLARRYRRDRTEGQPCSVYVGAEKDTLGALLWNWLGEYGIPILVLRGYSSQTYLDDIRSDVISQERPAKLLYLGDFDPTGEDIERQVREAHIFEEVVRIAVLPDQVRDLGLEENEGKETDSRAAGFYRRHGILVQVELEAIDPDALRAMTVDAFLELFDLEVYQQIVDEEDQEREELET
jgi:hypothetical protein